MPAPLLVRPSALLAKVETTKGTAETLTATEGAFNVFNVTMSETTSYVRRPAMAGFTKMPGVPGAMIGTCSFSVYVHGNGTTGVPAWASTFLLACGFVNTSGTFARTGDTSLQKTITLAHYKGAGTTSIKQTLAGAVGNFRLIGRNGQPSQIDFTFTGKFTSEATSTLPSPTFPTVLPPRGYETLQINSVDLLAPEFTYDTGGTTLMLEGPNDSSDTGYVHGIITDFNPTLTTEPYQEALTVLDWRALFAASTEVPFNAVIGSTANNIVTIATSKLQITSGPGFGNREQAWTRTLNFDDNAGATIAFT